MRAIDLLLIFVFIVTSLLAHFVAAGSWNVVQSIELDNADLHFKQTDHSTHSRQAGNAVFVSGDVVYAEQRLAATNRDIILIQENGSSQNHQAVNVIEADGIKNVTQELKHANSINLLQHNGIGSANTQAINKITELDNNSQMGTINQSIQTQNISFLQNGGHSNWQTANLIESQAEITGDIHQTLNADVVSFQQSNGNVSNLQAVNAVISDGLSGTVTQSTTATITTVTGVGSDPNGIRTFNYIKNAL